MVWCGKRRSFAAVLSPLVPYGGGPWGWERGHASPESTGGAVLVYPVGPDMSSKFAPFRLDYSKEIFAGLALGDSSDALMLGFWW